MINEGKGVIIYIADSKTTHVDVDRYLADDAITVSARYRFKWFFVSVILYNSTNSCMCKGEYYPHYFWVFVAQIDVILNKALTRLKSL